MDNTFVVQLRKGIVNNNKRDTSRRGCWVPVESLPRKIALALGMDRDNVRPGVSWDVENAGIRNMKNAAILETRFAVASLVQFPDGRKGIALLD